MNDVFSFQRLGLLLRKFLKEHFYTYLLYIAGLFGILFVLYGLTMISALKERFPVDVPPIYFLGGLILGSFIFASSFYSFFNNKAKGIQFLNLPSSHAEKLVLGFLFTQIVFFITYFLVFFVIDRLMGGIYDQFHTIKASVPREYYQFYRSVPMDFTERHVIGGIILAIVLSAMAHYGSLIFEKHAFVKAGLIVLIIGFLHIYYNFFSMKAMIPEEAMPGGMFYTESLRLNDTNSVRYEGEMKIVTNSIRGVILLPKSWDKFLYWFLPSFLYLMFWGASYFKLKEKQV
ncbi:MAG: hypothetical protein JO301_02070 [Chitinophagaceae bacterium]|nr:hypothetical protein [Chitinophagaceae bacterium]